MPNPLPDRDAFHVPAPGPYLLAHSAGCLPRVAEARLGSHYLAPWSARGGGAWETWLAEVDGFRAALAALLGGRVEDYCPQANLSSGLSKLLAALPPPQGARRRWLIAEEAFPSLGFVLHQARRLGFELRMLPRGGEVADPATWQAEIDERVHGVLATHVHSNSGVVTPIEAIAATCAERGALCVVDVAQSAGVLPLDVATLGASAVLGSCIKWLCGGPGADFIWLDPALTARLDPPDVGWFSHAEPFEFDIHRWQPAPDARRLWGGTPDIAPYVLAGESLRLLAGAGVAAIREHNLALQRRFVAALPPAWRSRVPLAGRGGTLCLAPGAALADVRRRLDALGAHYDQRGDVLRLSFHLWNDLAQAQALAAAFGPDAPLPVPAR